MRRATFAIATAAMAFSHSIAWARGEDDLLSPFRDATRLHIRHLPDDVFTYARLSVAALRREPDLQRATLTSRSAIEKFVATLEIGRPLRLARASEFDARWEIVGTSVGGKMHSIAFDRFGSTGRVDGVAVKFTSRPFVNALSAQLPHFIQ